MKQVQFHNYRPYLLSNFSQSMQRHYKYTSTQYTTTMNSQLRHMA